MQQDINPVKEWTITQGLSYFIQKWEERGNEKETVGKYQHSIDLLTEWLTVRKLQNEPADILVRKHIELCLQENRQLYLWSNRTYNNNMLFLRTVFTYLVKEGIMKKNPCDDIDRKKTKSKKHRYYDPVKFELIRGLMKEHDPLLFFAARIIYYLCIRSEKELKHFKVGNIFIDRKQVLITAEEAKTDADRYIPIPDEMLQELQVLVKNFPGDHFVIGVSSKNKFIAGNKPAPQPFGKGFLSKRFAKIRTKAGLPSDYTLYGFKHTRVIHLKSDGGKDADIMSVTGHTSYQAYSDYLRDLGMEANPGEINKISRKF